VVVCSILGLGRAYASLPFAQKGWDVVGIDGSRADAELVHAKRVFAASCFVTILLTVSIPHYGAKFDLLLCAGVLEFYC
jgi:hypothetical protein